MQDTFARARTWPKGYTELVERARGARVSCDAKYGCIRHWSIYISSQSCERYSGSQPDDARDIHHDEACMQDTFARARTRHRPSARDDRVILNKMAKHARQVAVRRPPISQQTHARTLNATRQHGDARGIQFNYALSIQTIHAAN